MRLLTDGPLDAAHRRWLYINAVVVPALLNGGINAGQAWFVTRDDHRVPLWPSDQLTNPSTALDALGLLFIVPFFAGIATTIGVRRELRKGRLLPLDLTPAVSPWWTRLATTTERLPEHSVARGFVVGAACFVLFAPLLVLGLIGTGFGDVTSSQFIVFKASLAVLIGAVATPLIGICALLGQGESNGPFPDRADRDWMSG